jgi:16S rRNA A1518/A1519 N6-dimethyltransferase RsmA/KsgA/DIM1 with predicted DNA glycosylase/AP lyase activity
MTRARTSTLWRTQNFLRDPQLAERLVRRSGIGPSDVVYDLGAGSGVLTAALAARAARVVAVEKDPGLAERLRARFQAQTNVVIRQADIRTYPLPRAAYVVFASPPFEITATIMRRLTNAPVPPRDAWLVLQREAAERYLGSPQQTLAALRIAPWFSVEVLHRFRKSDFAPRPAVDVVFVRVHKRGPPRVPERDARLYRDFVAAVFTAWRPSVGRSLSDAIGTRPAARLLAAAGIDPASRPSAIALHGWLALYERFSRLPEPLRVHVAGAEPRLQRRQRRLVKRHRTRAPRDGLAVTRLAKVSPYAWHARRLRSVGEGRSR